MVPGFEPLFFSFLSFLPLVPSDSHLKQLKYDLAQESTKRKRTRPKKQMLFLIMLGEKSDAFRNFNILSGCRVTSKKLSRLQYYLSRRSSTLEIYLTSLGYILL